VRGDKKRMLKKGQKMNSSQEPKRKEKQES